MGKETTLVEAYVRDLRDIAQLYAGTLEIPYCVALRTLLDVVGKVLKPQVRCVLTLANSGAVPRPSARNARGLTQRIPFFRDALTLGLDRGMLAAVTPSVLVEEMP